jgi:hypothetical protein
MINAERPMRVATVRALGVFLVVFAIGLAISRAIALITWNFEITFDQEAMATAFIAAVSAISFIVGLRLLQDPARLAPRLMTAAIVAIGIPLAFGMRGLELPSTTWLSANERAAFEYLRAAKQVEMPYVGFLAVRSRGYLAMRILRRSIAADGAFKELLRSGTTAGQLYGLCGVYNTDPVAFSAALPRYRSATASVDLFSGCVIGAEPVARVACSDDGFRIPRGVSLEQWFASDRRHERRHDLDICGGVLPAIFSERDHDEAAALQDERLADFRDGQ